MNRKNVLAALAFAVIGSSAFAQEATPDTWMKTPAVKSFDQVSAELFHARRDGSIKATSLAYIEKIDSARSRDEVRAEAIAARRSGELQAINNEAYAFTAPAGPLTVLARLR